jgi:hypothetical protein
MSLYTCQVSKCANLFLNPTIRGYGCQVGGVASRREEQTHFRKHSHVSSTFPLCVIQFGQKAGGICITALTLLAKVGRRLAGCCMAGGGTKVPSLDNYRAQQRTLAPLTIAPSPSLRLLPTTELISAATANAASTSYKQLFRLGVFFSTRHSPQRSIISAAASLQVQYTSIQL